MNKRLAAGFLIGMSIGATGTAGVFAWNSGYSRMPKSRVVLENDKVRVKEAIFIPGEKPGIHTHDLPHVGVTIDGGTLKFNYPDGKTETLQLKDGDVGYRDAHVTHEAVNMGKSPIKVIEVEIK
jgi:quercetin dioxygenase-like cupin family protein